VERHGNSTPQTGNNSACRPTYHKTEWALRLTLLAPDIAIAKRTSPRFGGMAIRSRRTKSSLRLGSIAHLFRTSMARNAKQINAPVGAEVFSLAQQQFEKYGLRASNKPCDFNYIKNPYQIPVVQRSREKTAKREYRRRCSRDRSAELRSESPAKPGDFRRVTSRERKLGTAQLAEGEELESNILQLCRPSKCLDSRAFAWPL
jgi:hypothetical protein